MTTVSVYGPPYITYGTPFDKEEGDNTVTTVVISFDDDQERQNAKFESSPDPL